MSKTLSPEDFISFIQSQKFDRRTIKVWERETLAPFLREQMSNPLDWPACLQCAYTATGIDELRENIQIAADMIDRLRKELGGERLRGKTQAEELDRLRTENAELRKYVRHTDGCMLRKISHVIRYPSMMSNEALDSGCMAEEIAGKCTCGLSRVVEGKS